jgi:hypothetical protein
MPKRTRNFSDSKEASHAPDHQAAGQGLANLYRVAIFDQILRLEDDPALSHDDKLTTLYQIFHNLVQVINRISSPAPEKAPELWGEKDRRKSAENIDAFIRRVYSSYAAKGMTMAHLSRLDHHGYQAWYGWKKLPANRGSETPLPTRSLAHDLALANLEQKISLAEIARMLPEAIGDQYRLYRTAANRRSRHKNHGPA